MTYQIFKNDRLEHDNLTANQLFNVIPAGSVLISGNRTKMIQKPEGGVEELTEIKATYKLLQGGTLTVIQKP